VLPALVSNSNFRPSTFTSENANALLAFQNLLVFQDSGDSAESRTFQTAVPVNAVPDLAAYGKSLLSSLAFVSNGWRHKPQTWRHAGNRAVAELIEQADSTFPAVVA